jgi:hypothetical protein
VHLEASTKPHVHRKFENFWTNIASTMACPNFKNGPKNGLAQIFFKELYALRRLGQLELLLNVIQVFHNLFGFIEVNYSKNFETIFLHVTPISLKVHMGMCTFFWTIKSIITKIDLLNGHIFFTLQKDFFIN